MLDGLVNDFRDKYPPTSSKPKSNKVNNPEVENGITKIQSGAKGLLNSRKKLAPEPLSISIGQDLRYGDRIILAGHHASKNSSRDLQNMLLLKIISVKGCLVWQN